MSKCERCGKKVPEEGLYLDEDTHNMLCEECYYGDLAEDVCSVYGR